MWWFVRCRDTTKVQPLRLMGPEVSFKSSLRSNIYGNKTTILSWNYPADSRVSMRMFRASHTVFMMVAKWSRLIIHITYKHTDSVFDSSHDQQLDLIAFELITNCGWSLLLSHLQQTASESDWKWTKINNFKRPQSGGLKVNTLKPTQLVLKHQGGNLSAAACNDI